jgi:hypothetical protein
MSSEQLRQLLLGGGGGGGGSFMINQASSNLRCSWRRRKLCFLRASTSAVLRSSTRKKP